MKTLIDIKEITDTHFELTIEAGKVQSITKFRGTQDDLDQYVKQFDQPKKPSKKKKDEVIDLEVAE